MGTFQKQIIFIVIFICTLCSCDTYTVAWTGQTYSGSITKDSYKVDISRIYNTSIYEYCNIVDIGCGGTWDIEVESLDNVNIYIEIKENGCEFADSIIQTTTSSKISFEHKYEAGFRIYLKVAEDETLWNKNDCKARYTIKAVLK